MDVLLKSLGRFAIQVRAIQGYELGRREAGALRHIGPDLVCGRLWQELGLDTALNRLLEDRGFEFSGESGPSHRAAPLSHAIREDQARTYGPSKSFSPGLPEC
uniref:Uncharacterized protein n=1 Tax=Desulfobacca acetoxidans TaxID=60893 RepID=A0A7C5AMR3_9BACT